MKHLFLFIFLTAFFQSLYAETENDVVLRMTEEEVKTCYENKKKTEQRFLIKKDFIGHMGFIDGCGRIVVEPVYNLALEFSEGLARVKKDGKFGFIDKSGNVVIDFYLDFAWFFHEGLALAEISGTGLGSVDLNPWLNDSQITTNFAYDIFGRITSRTNDRSGVTEYRYYDENPGTSHSLNKLKSIQIFPALTNGDTDYTDPGSVAQKYTYTYDDKGDEASVEYTEGNNYES